MKLFVATPTYGGNVDVNYHSAMIMLANKAQSYGVDVIVPYLSAESLITRARNTLLHDFMCSDADMIAWIDSDIGFNPDDLMRLCNTPFDFVCAAYPKKGLDLKEFKKWVLENPNKEIEAFHSYAYNQLDVPNMQASQYNGGLFIEVQHAATGFMIWKRSVAEKLIEASKDYVYITDNKGVQETCFRVFHTDCDRAYYLSEDYWVCDRWRETGGKVHVDLNTKLTHSGRWTWHGQLGAQFKREV